MKGDKWRVVYGYLLLLVIAVMGMAFGLGKVEEKSSYGLGPLLIILTLLGDRWASWAFPKRDEQGKDDKREIPEC